MPDKIIYDEDYYERGLESGKSAYQNYRWIPELTIPMAMTIIDFLKITRDELILDFGCAKGYLVKALCLLYRNAFGLDTSEYAISNCDPSVENKCFIDRHSSKFPPSFDLVIAKDVFEHIKEEKLRITLKVLNTKRLFAIIPLGDSAVYRAPLNNCDISHVICANEYWWIRFFSECGYTVNDFRFEIPGIKDHYYEEFPTAHGFFTMVKDGN